MKNVRCTGVLLAALVLAGCALDDGAFDEELDAELGEAEAVGALPDLYLSGLILYPSFYRARGCNSGPSFFFNTDMYVKSTNLANGQVASQIGWYPPFSWYMNTCYFSAVLSEAVVSTQYPTTYDLVIDSTNIIAEANETNNTVRVGSDFNAGFLFRDSVYRFQYCNIGQTPVTPTSNNIIKAKLLNKKTGASVSFFVPIPAPAQCLETTFACADIGDPTCTGAVTVKAKIDSTTSVVELSESNNKVVVKFAAGAKTGTPVPDDDPTDP